MTRPREALLSAVQALLGHRLRSALSILGISIGISAVVSIVALTSAVQKSIDNEVGSLLGGRLKVWTGNAKLAPNVQPHLFRASELDAVRGLPGARSVAIELKGDMLARQGAHDGTVKVHGADHTTMSSNRLRLVEGRAISGADFEQGKQVAVIDGKVRDTLFRPGEPVLGSTLLLAQPGTSESGPNQQPERNGRPHPLIARAWRRRNWQYR